VPKLNCKAKLLGLISLSWTTESMTSSATNKLPSETPALALPTSFEPIEAFLATCPIRNAGTVK